MSDIGGRAERTTVIEGLEAELRSGSIDAFPRDTGIDFFDTLEASPAGESPHVLTVREPWHLRANILKRGENRTGTFTVTDDGNDLYVLNGTFTVTLPAVATNNGRTLYFLNKGPGTITLDGAGAETINGALTWLLQYRLGHAILYCDGTEWLVIGEHPVRGMATQGSFFLGDPIPHRNCIVCSFEQSSGATAATLLHDAYNSFYGDVQAGTLLEASTSVFKFGTRSVHIVNNGAGGTAGLSWEDAVCSGFFGFNGTVAVAGWVRFAAVTGRHPVFNLGPSTGNDRLYIEQDTGAIKFIVNESSATPTTNTHPTAVVANTWYFIAFTYTSGTRQAKVWVNGNVQTYNFVTGPLITSFLDLDLGGFTAAQFTGACDFYVDDLLFRFDGIVPEAVFTNHHARNIPWSSRGFVQSESSPANNTLALAMPFTGSVALPGADDNGTLKAASALALPGIASNTHAPGVWRILDEAQRGDSAWQLNAGASTTFAAVPNLFSFVPYGVRAILFQGLVRLLGTGAHTSSVLYLRRRGSTTGVVIATETLRSSQTNLASGTNQDVGSQVMSLCDSIGRVDYAVTVNTNAWLQIRGYA